MEMYFFLRRRRQRIARESRLLRRLLRDSSDPLDVPQSQFKACYRLSQESTMYLMNHIEPHMYQGRRRSYVPALFRVLAVLHFFGTGSYRRPAGSSVLSCVSQSVQCRAIMEVANAIIKSNLKEWPKFPGSEQERRRIKAGFEAVGFPDILGAVDGTHIAITTPHVDAQVYINRKGFHSINAQIICDYDMRIWNVVARFPGSTDDSTVWRESRVSRIMQARYNDADVNTHLLGDSGYPLLPWLFTPVANAQEMSPEAAFNRRHCQVRSCVERCIGLLKARFRCLLKHRTLHYTPQNAARIILSCAVLHNVAIAFREDDFALEDEDNFINEYDQPEVERDQVLSREGQLVRADYIAANNFS